MLPLWDFQARAVNRVARLWQSGTRRVLLVAPTGAGKTRMGLELVQRAVREDVPVLFLVHREELLRQTLEVLSPLGDVGCVASGWSQDPSALIQVASVQTLA